MSCQDVITQSDQGDLAALPRKHTSRTVQNGRYIEEVIFILYFIFQNEND